MLIQCRDDHQVTKCDSKMKTKCFHKLFVATFLALYFNLISFSIKEEMLLTLTIDWSSEDSIEQIKCSFYSLSLNQSNPTI